MKPPTPITKPLPTMSAMNAQLSGNVVRTGIRMAKAMGAANTTYGAVRNTGEVLAVAIRSLRNSLARS